ncbi:MAG: AzlD domain-containing protein [Chloroflexota bacterium]|nr:MAG: branched-chain amino acid transport [Chloroflexota bacterium]
MNEFMLVLGMAVVTFAMRYPVMALVGRINLPDRVFQALRYVPPAVLSAIVVPELLLPDGERMLLAPENTRLVAGLVALLVAWKTKNLLLTIVLGMLSLWGWSWLLSALTTAGG